MEDVGNSYLGAPMAVEGTPRLAFQRCSAVELKKREEITALERMVLPLCLAAASKRIAILVMMVNNRAGEAQM